jgi:hypothetical protein
MSDDLARKLSELVTDVVETNDALSDGVDRLLVGKRVTSAACEVWDSDGRFSITLAFEDGSTVESPGETWATGPLAELVRMAGGNPDEPKE